MKKIAILLVSVLMTVTLSTYADEIKSEVYKTEKDSFTIKLSLVSGPKITVDGTNVEFSPAAYEENDRIYVPIRQLLELNGYTVSYEEETESIFCINMQTNDIIAMQIGNKMFSVNGTNYDFDVAPLIKEDRTFVPIRIIYEMLGYNVDFDESSNTAIITSK